VIPCLLVAAGRLVKTVGFRKPRYVGDPINTVRIFNEKEVDEIIILDIEASRRRTGPEYDRIVEIGSQCFMPLCYGGGIRTVEDARRILGGGAEKVAINTAAVERPGLVAELANSFGSQSVVVSIDARPRRLGRGYEVVVRSGKVRTGRDAASFAREVEQLGAGEVLLTAIERDGAMSGYDLNLTAEVAGAVRIPVIACGGAGGLADLRSAITEGGASAVAAGSIFVFHGPRRAVLISYPTREQIERLLT
jgi:cyclase